MKQKKSLYFSSEIILFPLLFVILIWLAFWIDLRFNFRFSKWGIYPMKVEGLKGVLFAPFIHGSLKHLFNNSIPLFALSAALFFFYRNLRWKVLFWGTLLTGLLTWVIARPAMHIGASGVVYMLVAFLFFKGIISRRYQLIAISMIVVFVYGGLLRYLFPVDPKISWEGHLSGFIIGLILAFVLKQQSVENKKYAWEQDDYDPEKDLFLQHFDEDGNFIEKLAEEEKGIEASEDNTMISPITVRYILKNKSNEENN
ncbi:MAG: rhomboid family intramembrane serine protease [Flavobacteriaceae bacterium]|nr:rhomboid family intramembrane serine protease [Flavobacteriaceae bacterium]